MALSHHKIYDWRRYWVSREGVISFADRGFVPEPNDDFGTAQSFAVVPFEEIAHVPCLALLGEPGIGKTESLTHLPAGPGTSITLRRDLSAYGSDYMLHKAIFEAPEFTSWINSADTLELFLDSLDECLIHVRTVARLLVEELAKYPRSRLRLRIACRTAEWPQLLTEELPRLWGNGQFAVYELAPLTRQNVRDAAQAEGLDPELFLEEIDSRSIAALAMKPVTLLFLLQLRHNFPETQAELYRQGCLRLCSYENTSRLASEGISHLSSEERLAVAERIAAITMFSKRSSVFIGNNEAEANNDDIKVSELACDFEHVADRALEVTPKVVAEVIRTGLFTGRAGERMGWGHWTFSEFLAARYATRNGLSTDQIADLVMHPESRDRVVPQLRETAAWLAAMNPDFMDRMIATDPQVLLATTITSADATTRERLTESILRRYDEGGATERDPNFSPRFDVLKHPHIASQLRPYLVNKNHDAIVRRVALDIVEACSLSELYDTLVDIALDRTESWYLRHRAAFAISRLGVDAQKQKLRPLLNTTPVEDPEDELRGDALLALWPDHLPVQDVFQQIDRERHGTLFGTYSLFLVYHFLEGLKPKDLPTALDWVAAHPPQYGFPSWHDVAGKIMRLAWDKLSDPLILEAFAKAAISRTVNHAEWFDAERNPDINLTDTPREQRAAILHVVVEHAVQHNVELPRFWAMEARIITRRDLPWLLDELRQISGTPAQREWTRLVRSAFDSSMPEDVDLIMSRMEEIVLLRDAFAPIFAPIELGSPIALEMQKSHRRRAAAAAASAMNPLPPISERVAKLLTSFEAGDLSAWWRLNVELARRRGRTDEGEFVADVRSLPAWSELDENLRERCVAAAQRYAIEGAPNNEQWLGTNIFYRPAAGGYRALRLLLHERPEILATFPAAVWEKWSGIILAFPESYGKDEIASAQDLARQAYARAPHAITNTLLRLIDKENTDHGSVFILSKIEQCWDESLAATLRDKLRTDLSLRPETFGQLLSELLKHDREKGVAVALEVLGQSTQESGLDPKRVKSAKALLEAAAAESWEAIWSAIQSERALGRQLFAELAHEAHMSQVPKLSTSLSPQDVGQLFVWLEREFPHAEDPKEEGGHEVTSRESIGHYRNALLTGLKERGTPAAVEVLRQLARDLPQVPWLNFIAADAERQRLRRTWIGVDPSALYSMTASRRPRLVESANQLLGRIVESLDRLQARLRGETPAVPDLWDKDRPKDEDHFSNYIKRHLSDDLAGQGIIANREVKIRKGEFTDIHVDAIRRVNRGDSLDVVTVILEAKGCWNTGLKTDMRDQLRDRYLKETQCRHGLYVVGWFFCPEWTNEDYRRSQTPKWSVENAKEFFSSQAAELSVEGYTLQAYVIDAALR